MTTGELVDVYLTHKQNAGGNDHQNAALRRRAVEALQETVEEVWDEADWDFKKTTTTGTLTSGSDSTDAPSDFVTAGEGGKLFIQSASEWIPLEYKDPTSLFILRENSRNGSGLPTFYTIAQQDTDYTTQAIFDCPADTTYTLRFYYDAATPLILDRPLAITLTDAQSAGSPNGAYYYRAVFVGEDGSESEAGDVSSVTVNNSAVNLSTIPIGSTGVVTRKIYRTTAGDANVLSAYKLLTTIEDNTTTTYQDNTADGALGVSMTATNTNSSLKKIPRDYHRSVLLKGLVAKRYSDQGSANGQKLEADYRRELGRMKSRRRHGLEDLERIGEDGISSYRMH